MISTRTELWISDWDVTLQGKQNGTVNVSPTVRAVGDESSNDYVVGTTHDGILRVRPPAGPTSLESDRLLRLLEELETEGMACQYPVCDQLSAAGLTDDERALVYLQTDGGETRYYLARIEDGRVTESRRVDDPETVDQTINVRTDAGTVEEISDAQDRPAALGEAVRSDRITFDGVGTGLGNRVRIAVATFAMAAFEFASGIASWVTNSIAGLVGWTTPTQSTPVQSLRL